MRIIAGEYASRKLKTLPGNDTRPTMDKVRGAVFSSLGGFFEGGRILDLYGGSGAVTLEALSRGFAEGIIEDSARAAAAVIRENAESLGVTGQCRIMNMRDTRALGILSGEGVRFDLVYLDPPYAKQHNAEIITYLDEKDMLEDGARITVECRKEDELPDRIGRCVKYKEAVYGITRIVYYQTEDQS